MNTQLILLFAYSIAMIPVDGLVWGTAGYLVFRLVGGSDRRWFVGAIALAIVFYLWDSGAADAIGGAMALQLQTNSEAASALLGGDLWAFDPFYMAIHLLCSVIGFRIGKALFNRTLRRISGPVESLPTPVLASTPADAGAASQ